MEQELHRLIREACGGEWNEKASHIWKLIEAEKEEAVSLYRIANQALQRELDAIKREYGNVE